MNERSAVLLVIMSVFVFAAGFLPAIIESIREAVFYHKNPRGCFTGRYSFSTKLLILTLGLIVSIWILRYTVAYYSSFHGCPNDIGRLGFSGKEFFNSFLHALQTFSMDESYTDYWVNGQEMIAKLSSGNEAARWFYNAFCSIQNIMAPVIGGAVVFEMLTKAFPTFRLFCIDFLLWKEKYYFSELNENSLALARSILSEPSRRNATLIFADAYAEDDEEDSTGWLLEAKAMGAICLKADLLHISYNRLNRKRKFIFLIDKSENKNIGMLAGMLDDDNIATYQNALIYVFSTDRKYSNIEDEVSGIVNIARDKVEKRNQKLKPKIRMPYVVPVNAVRNMADHLMQEVPLFEVLIGSEQRELTVTIIGGGSVGTEMFLAAYRFGQILDVRLNVNMVSREPETSDDSSTVGFADKINYINPEILRSADPNDELLICNCDPEHPERSAPYMDFRYDSDEVMSDRFIRKLRDDPRFVNTDYFIIALGSDEDDYLVAEKIKSIVAEHHIAKARDKKTVIAFCITNSDLMKKLNEHPQRRYIKDRQDSDIYMYAFGSKNEVYSCDNVFFGGINYADYLTGQYNEDHLKRSEKKKRRFYETILGEHYEKLLKDIYNQMSSVARLMHLKYKIFSAQRLCHKEYPFCVFDRQDAAIDHDEQNRRLIEAYRDTVLSVVSDEEDKEKTVLHRLAWLEHRRWNAFMRTCGFRGASAEVLNEYYSLRCFEHSTPNYKFIPIKLHPCIVECSEKGMIIPFCQDAPQNGGMSEEQYQEKIAAIRAFCSKHRVQEFDRLDDVSYRVWELALMEKMEEAVQKSEKDHKPIRYAELYALFQLADFKIWDYPYEEKLTEDIKLL